MHGLSTKDEGICWNKSLINSSRRKQKKPGARRYEQTDKHKVYRNSPYPCQLTTRMGRLSLRVSRIRDGSSPPNRFNDTNEVNKF
ncbi:MAG: transposase [Bacillales bacterium]|nr:transposase [Bacillales bacterium]